MTPAQRDYSNPTLVCDIVMKGGITSGVVYPLALCEIAEKYRFANIGGASAGAMAAAAAAAAEYGRYTLGGFSRLAAVPEEVSRDLLGLFHPTPKLRPLFNIFVAMLKGKGTFSRLFRAAAAALIGYWPWAALGALVGYGIAAAIVNYTDGADKTLLVIGPLFALATAILATLVRVYFALARDLPEADFGLCSGKTARARRRRQPAFTDWLARLIQELAGRDVDDAPLTFGDLARNSHQIDLKMMTTSLMERRPYTLPLQLAADAPKFAWERGEWAALFPTEVVEYLADHCAKWPSADLDEPPKHGKTREFFEFPGCEHLPLVVAARMSLSFPLLVAAVPLWREDHTYPAHREERRKLRRCLFSDGGLSSNFPIHFFDGLLPRRPTFAISLEAFDPRRQDDETWMSDLNEAAPTLPVQPLEGLVSFLLRLVDSAKDWQDNLQSLLPGYRERIVYLGLKRGEGGLNVAMSSTTVKDLANRGQKAGQRLVKEFDNISQNGCYRWDEHRWRRYLIAQARLEDTIETVGGRFDPTEANGWSVFLSPEGYGAKPRHYSQDPQFFETLVRRNADLSQLWGRWKCEPRFKKVGRLPQPDTDLRITPKP